MDMASNLWNSKWKSQSKTTQYW